MIGDASGSFGPPVPRCPGAMAHLYQELAPPACPVGNHGIHRFGFLRVSRYPELVKILHPQKVTGFSFSKLG